MTFLEWFAKNTDAAMGLVFGTCLILIIIFIGSIHLIRAIKGTD